jgi:hypothetical protein
MISSFSGTSGFSRPIHDGVKDNAGSFAAKRKLARGHFVKHNAEGKKIAASVEFLSADLLRGHVGNGAEGGAWTGELIGANADRFHGIAVAAGAD